MTDPASISEQSTITIGLLVGSIGTLIMATRAFVNLARDVKDVREDVKDVREEMKGVSEEMIPRSELREILLRIAKDNPGMKFTLFEDHAA